MDRKTELMEIFKDMGDNVKTLVTPMIDDLVFIEAQLVELRKYPFIKYHPEDPNRQMELPNYKVYKAMVSQQKDIVRFLSSLITKGGDTEGDDPLDAYFKRKGKL